MKVSKRKKAMRRAFALQPICRRCGKRGRHYIYPSLGEQEIWLCEFENEEKEEG